MSSLLDNLLVFGRTLRRLGMDVHPGRMLDLVDALSHIDIRRRDQVFHACRALLVHRHEQLALFDQAFEEFWDQAGRKGPPYERAGPVGRALTARLDERASPAGPPGTDVGRAFTARRDVIDDDSDSGPETGAWSDTGGIANKDFAAFTAEDMAIARAALDRLAWNPGERRTRRWIQGRGPRVDVRRALARSLRTGGDVAVLPTRRRRVRPRPLVLLCDVSGSMERYSRMLLHFAHAIAARHRRVEAFLFSTRLTRVTTQLRLRQLDAAVGQVSRAVPDWSGGTRIGDALKEFQQRWGRRVLNGGPVVLLISDGWDRGEPALLRDQVARLQRSCHRLIWLNPLIGTTDYAPLTRGLQAAMPFVDDFLATRTLNNLAELAVHLTALAKASGLGRGYARRGRLLAPDLQA